MTAVNLKLYKLLIKLGATEQEAEEVSNDIVDAKSVVLEQDNKIDKLDAKMDNLKNQIDGLKEEMRSKFNILITINVAVLGAFMATLLAFVFLK